MCPQGLPEKEFCPETDMDWQVDQSGWMQEHNQIAQDHWANYRHHLGKMTLYLCPGHKGQKINYFPNAVLSQNELVIEKGLMTNLIHLLREVAHCFVFKTLGIYF